MTYYIVELQAFINYLNPITASQEIQRTEEGVNLYSRGMQVPTLLRTNDPVSSTNTFKGRQGEQGLAAHQNVWSSS